MIMKQKKIKSKWIPFIINSKKNKNKEYTLIGKGVYKNIKMKNTYS